MRLLLVEDDRMIGEAVKQGLELEGFAVDWVQDGGQAELAIANGIYGLVLLDLGLPRRDGLALLKDLRRRRVAVPVLIATARDEVADRIEGLNAGADDYLVKPFHLPELVARVRALLRRSQGRANPEIEHGALRINPVTHAVHWRGAPVELSAKEFALLQALVDKPDAVLSREQLEDRLYGWGEEVGSNAVEVHIHNLRRKLGARAIRNIRGVGYRVELAE
jgi:two-component system response regulator QseB